MSYAITIDEPKCGACARECAWGCARHLPVYRSGQGGSNGLDCVGCLHCYAVCPRGAVSGQGLPEPENGGPPLEPASLRGLLVRGPLAVVWARQEQRERQGWSQQKEQLQ